MIKKTLKKSYPKGEGKGPNSNPGRRRRPSSSASLLKKKISPDTDQNKMLRTWSANGKTIYIGNLNYNIDENSLWSLFGKFGKVCDVNLLTNPGKDSSKGIAFVNMLKANDAEKAIEKLNGRIIGGRTAKVSEAVDNKAPSTSFASKHGKTTPRLSINSGEEDSKTISPRKRQKRKTGLAELFERIGKK